jgi:hypothetical protein
MSTDADKPRFEFPDEAGYPDGTGFLDEGTTENGHENHEKSGDSGEGDVSSPE